MLMKYKFPIALPDLQGNTKAYVNAALESGWVSSLGPYIGQLEAAWAKAIGTKYAVACSSGTTALTLALAALKIGPGDEVIVPDFTMIATAWAVTYLGATPVFVDCGQDMNINVDLIEAAITPKTKAILPVHIYGRPCNMEAIMKISHDYNIPVVEDACEAHGGWDSKEGRLGGIGLIGCFSLYSNKIITAGEGGLITTNDENIYKQLKHLRGMAFDPNHTFLHKKVAYNYRMPNLSAAVALAQVERMDEFLAKRKQILEWYDRELVGKTVARPNGSVLWMYDLLCKDQKERDEIMERCLKNGVECRYVFKPMSQQPMFKKSLLYRLKDYHAAGMFADRGMYLPVYTDLTEENVKEICSYVKG